jgi:hypothetical protein
MMASVCIVSFRQRIMIMSEKWWILKKSKEKRHVSATWWNFEVHNFFSDIAANKQRSQNYPHTIKLEVIT